MIGVWEAIMNGEVAYLYTYDIAYEADLPKIKTLLGAAEGFRLGHLKDAPRNFPFYRSLILQTEDMQLDGPTGPLTLSTTIKLFSVGAISVNVRVPVSWQRLTDLVAYRDLRFQDQTTLDMRIRKVVERLFETVKAQLDTPVAALEQPEVYTIFCLNSALTDAPTAAAPAPGEFMEEWLRRNHREVAALLDGETDPTRLSDQEVQDSMKYKYSYYHYDLAVLDWDTALLVDTPEGCLETLYILEVANLQLEELKVYDAKLDAVLDQAYDDVEAVARPHAFRQRRRVLANLRELRMDLTKVADELTNITKFIGDWHLARIYMGCAARFHLTEWEDIVSQKLRTLDSLYMMLQQDGMNRAMLMLEMAIVGLFVIDLVIIVVLGIK
jgi:hypothetical protein